MFPKWAVLLRMIAPWFVQSSQSYREDPAQTDDSLGVGFVDEVLLAGHRKGVLGSLGLL